jgi:hypothetical protein
MPHRLSYSETTGALSVHHAQTLNNISPPWSYLHSPILCALRMRIGPQIRPKGVVDFIGQVRDRVSVVKLVVG